MTHFKYTFIFPEVKYPFKMQAYFFINSVKTHILLLQSEFVGGNCVI